MVSVNGYGKFVQLVEVSQAAAAAQRKVVATEQLLAEAMYEQVQGVPDLSGFERYHVELPQSVQSAIRAQELASNLARVFDQFHTEELTALFEWRTAVRQNFEQQLELDSPNRYESHPPNPQAKAMALTLGRRFTNTLRDIDHPDFNQHIVALDKALDEFEEEPEDVLDPVTRFIRAQDALLRWLCVQSEDIDADGKDSAGLPTFTKSQKERALRAHYRSLFNVAEDTDFAGTMWLPYWEHRHEIIHGGYFVANDMNFATVALLQYVLIAFTVIACIEEHTKGGRKPPSVIEDHLNDSAETASGQRAVNKNPGSLVGEFLETDP